ncbi:MAG TPA: PHB depolymerase family esterase [Blastocatellia bacterium]|nr:PHB depolymerase family esterase [Blastocatellia bacterium]
MYIEFLWLFIGVILAMIAPDRGGEPEPVRNTETGLLTRAVTVGKTSYSYQVYVPANLRESRSAPVILFLHGIGQRGSGGLLQATGASIEFARAYLEQIPAIIVLPQCLNGRLWPEPDMEQMAIAALDQSAAEFGGDASRLYLTGVSMGGYGAWSLASAYPDKFAAVVPICGGSPLRTPDRFASIARKVARTPVWVFHGADDRIVPVSESRSMVKALKDVNGNVRYSEFAGVGHNVWLNALAERELLPWMLSQRLSK